jgi:hypothetical protein
MTVQGCRNQIWQWQVINTVTVLVDRLPEDQFVDPPDSPPSMFSSQESTDSLTTDITSAPTPANAQETARNNIIREMVETERKYVQDLEIMQACLISPPYCLVATDCFGTEILQRSVAKQHNISRYNTPSISGS